MMLLVREKFPLDIDFFVDDELVKFSHEMVHKLAKVKNVNVMDEVYQVKIVP
jgi:hypothetical protein